MGGALRKTAWFIVLWLAGVGTVAVIGFIIRLFLK